MKRRAYFIISTAIVLSTQVIWGQSNVYPFLWGTSLVVEAGRLEGQKKELGEGTLFRSEIFTRVFRSHLVLDLLEFGGGAQYYDKDYQGLYPYEMAVPEVWARVTKDQLTDYFIFLATRFNFPTPSIFRFFAGSRIGVHVLKRDYEWDHLEWTGNYTEVTPMNDNFESRSFGYDIYAGIRIAASRLPIGVQAELGWGNITDVKESAYASSYASIGVYLEH